jgi:Flp pilus assembly protein TadD
VRQNLAMVVGLQGKMGEAEQILRRELPPEQAEQSLQWLQARNSGGGAAASGATTPDTARTWSSLQGG